MNLVPDNEEPEPAAWKLAIVDELEVRIQNEHWQRRRRRSIKTGKEKKTMATSHSVNAQAKSGTMPNENGCGNCQNANAERE